MRTPKCGLVGAPEVAHAPVRDPNDYVLELIGPDTGRLRRVVQTATGDALCDHESGLGIAGHYSSMS